MKYIVESVTGKHWIVESASNTRLGWVKSQIIAEKICKEMNNSAKLVDSTEQV